MTIELKALFVEGIYRKSGAIAQVRNARRKIENAPGNVFMQLICFVVYTTTQI